MSKNKIILIIMLLLICVALTVIPLVLITDSDFAGADGMAEEQITEIDPNYQPWVESLIELPGGETESLLFCLQTAIGAIVIGYGFGYYRCRKKYSREEN
ncbi:MAG: energy-coupling factor ABC transporter substrate-binding protein [Clostridiales bacterium]